MSRVIVWDEPPEQKRPGRPGGEWVEHLQPLMERPGVWALVYEAKNDNSARQVAHRLLHRRTKRPDGKWEFTARSSGVYARYVGPS